MAATLVKQAECVSVVVDGSLGYGIWQTLRDARVAAEEGGLPLRIDVGACEQVERIGLGAIIVAQEKLGSVEVTGCNGWLVQLFDSFGVCAQCASLAACRTAAEPEAAALPH